MFRKMRRNKQEISRKEAEEVLKRGTSGVLAVLGDEGYPYAVPLSYVYEDNKIYFHSAASGHKLDAIKGNDKVSFCVIDKDEIVAEEFTTYFRSAIVFGKARILEGEEKIESLILLGERYSPGLKKRMDESIQKSFERVVLIEIKIEQMTGKEAIELVNRKR